MMEGDTLFKDMSWKLAGSQSLLCMRHPMTVKEKPWGMRILVHSVIRNRSCEMKHVTESFPVVLGDFGCDVTCQACRENSQLGSKPPLVTRIVLTGLGTMLVTESWVSIKSDWTTEPWEVTICGGKPEIEIRLKKFRKKYRRFSISLRLLMFRNSYKV